MIDSYLTLQNPSSGEFKDRGSKFIAFAWPVGSEEEALSHLEDLRKEHFKARHHCFAWRLGVDGQRFRANDDGEPSGTAGRPILGQIDALGLTDVTVVVVRYFGGVLLGASGLIHAYREAAAESLRQGVIVEKIIKSQFQLSFDYAIMPDIMQALKKLDIDILKENYGDHGLLEIGIRQSEAAEKLLKVKSMLWKVSLEEAAGLDWPPGLQFELLPT
jgi:uncharacterized YigZ family protein